EHEDAVIVDAGNDETEALFTLPQRIFGATALGQVTRDFGEANQVAVAVAPRSNDDVSPEPRAVLTDAPAFFLVGAFAFRDQQLVLGMANGDHLGRIKNGEMFADDFIRGVALETLGSGIPGQDVAGLIER